MKSLGDLNTILDDLRKVVALAGVSLPPSALSVEALPAPHKAPSSLPKGKAAVYVFILNGICLKVGKVGSKSQARFTSQHYNPASSNSNLARSLVAGQGKLGLSGITEDNVGTWIKNNVDRLNFLLNIECGLPVLTLIESFLQCRLQPIFEGFESQRFLKEQEMKLDALRSALLEGEKSGTGDNSLNGLIATLDHEELA